MAWPKSFQFEALLKSLRPSSRDIAIQALVAGLVFFGGKLGLLFDPDHLMAAPICPGAGLALGALLVFGYRSWAGIIIGVFLLDLTVLVDAKQSPIVTIAACVCMACAETLQALVAAWLIETRARGRDALGQPRTLAFFFALGAIIAPAISATSNSVVAVLAGYVKWREVDELWATIWLGNMVGIILLTPLLLAWSGRVRKLSLQRIAEGFTLLLLLVLASSITFGPSHAGRFRGVAFCMLIPTLLWTAFRFGDRGMAAANFIFGCFALLGTLRGYGPFVVGDRHTSFLLAQNFVSAFAIMALLLAAEVKQRRRIDDGLRASEQRYRDLFEYSPQPMWVFEYDSLRFLAVNQAAVRHYGYSRDEFLSMTICDIPPREDLPVLVETLKQARRGLEVPRHHRHRKKDGTLIDVEIGRFNLLVDGREAAMILVTDITERKQAERRAAAFSELGRRLSTASSPEEAAHIIVETADKLFGWTACRFELGPAASGLVKMVYGIENVEGRRSEIPSAIVAPSEITRRALKEGAQLVSNDLSTAPASLSSKSPPNSCSTNPIMAVPVRAEQCVLGVLSLESVPARPYTRQDLEIFQALADHCGGALERIRAETALRESDQRLRLALAASRMGIWTMELQANPRIISSPELDAIFGLKPGEFDGTEQTLFTFIHPEHHTLVRAAMAQAINSTGEYEIEFRILPRDRSTAWLLARGCCCFDARGEPTRLIGVAFDITARKASEAEVLRLNFDLERRVAERTAALEAINKELESFSYSVSHDLRAPLRSIRGFSEVLLDRYAAKLDERGREFLKRACQSSQQMDLLIDDLLKLSRIGRAELHQQTVDLSALAESIAGELRAVEPNRVVKFAITPGLLACGDERLLRIALENLLRNAWKFTAHQPKPRIEFGETSDPEPVYFVRDNGAGFDMTHASRLFGVFQRLHSASEFPGSGIGLATVQRILNRHGGRAWAEAQPDHGATFYFSLPHTAEHKSTQDHCHEIGTSAIVREQVPA